MGAIVWLASYPKSGNTWMRAFLHNLLRNPNKPANINELNKFCLGEDLAVYYNEFDPRPCSKMTAEEIAELRPKVHQRLTQAFPDSVFVKTHNYMGEWKGVPLVTMEETAGAIYIIRNPLDVVISYSLHYGLTIDEGIASLESPQAGTQTSDMNVRQIFNTWSIHVMSWTQTPSPSLHVVRYEDLIDQPFKTFGLVAKFLGLNPPRKRFQRAIANASFKVLRNQEDKHGFIERSQHTRFFREGKAGQWKTVLAPEQVASIVSTHREQMERFKYVPKGY